MALYRFEVGLPVLQCHICISVSVDSACMFLIFLCLFVYKGVSVVALIPNVIVGYLCWMASLMTMVLQESVPTSSFSFPCLLLSFKEKLLFSKPIYSVLYMILLWLWEICDINTVIWNYTLFFTWWIHTVVLKQTLINFFLVCKLKKVCLKL